MTSTARAITNLVLAQAVWFACVLGGNAGSVSLVLHLGIYQGCIGSLGRDWRILLPIAAIGYAVDSTLAALGFLHYPGPTLAPLLPAPLWLAALWLSFATLFLHGLQWLQGRLWLAAGLGAVAGAGTYYVGAGLSGATLGITTQAFLLVHALLWAIMTPLFTCLARTTPDAHPVAA